MNAKRLVAFAFSTVMMPVSATLGVLAVVRQDGLGTLLNGAAVLVHAGFALHAFMRGEPK